METIDEERSRAKITRFVITLVFLVAMAVGLCIMLAMTVRGVQEGDRAVQKLMARLAWVSVAMLGLTLLMLFWLVAHFLMQRIKPGRHEPTEYVDAWSLAGKRVKPPADDLEEEGEEGQDDEGPPETSR